MAAQATSADGASLRFSLVVPVFNEGANIGAYCRAARAQLGEGYELIVAYDFDEDDTFLLSDWFKHTPSEVLGKNFSVPADLFGHTPGPSKLYIFKAPVPGPLGPDKLMGAEPA